jgi:hypothetical protein
MPNVLLGVVPASTTSSIVTSATYTIAALAPEIELVAGIFLAFLVIQVIFGAIGQRYSGEVAPAYDDEDDDEEGGIM